MSEEIYEPVERDELRAASIAMALTSLIPKSTMAMLVEGERTILHGRMVGLDDEQTRDVVRTWSEWYRCTPWPLSWDRVRSAVTARSMGEEWRP